MERAACPLTQTGAQSTSHPSVVSYDGYGMFTLEATGGPIAIISTATLSALLWQLLRDTADRFG